MDKFDKLLKFDEFLKKQLESEEFKKEYDSLESAFASIEKSLENDNN